ncbi:TetR/AcrR family transcriptional regulator [Mycobacterium sp. URHB0044]|jgi:AcrR family transcriptional regulator|uniref:TetR/AcrR family transcriptional regulator n=1 Tax=Mycobacterium sp. URHB0044 TaxID=1380386 RepID=UPI000A784370
MLRFSTLCKVLCVTTTSPARTGRGRRTRPSGDEREAAILATAVRLLEHKKFADISVDDLARGAGLSRPTFYFYFASKDAVLLSLLEPLIQQADKEFDGAAQRLPADPRRVWRNGIDAFFSSFGSHSVVARAGSEAIATSPDVRAVWSAFMQKWINQTAEMIVAERERGAAPDTIPVLDLATSLNLMNERAMTATLVAEDGAVPQDRIVDTLTHIWVTSIYGRTP